MKNKSEAYSYLTMFCHLMQNQYGSRVRVVRSDNGSEFISRDMKEFFTTYGIEFSAVHPLEKDVGRSV